MDNSRAQPLADHVPSCFDIEAHSTGRHPVSCRTKVLA